MSRTPDRAPETRVSLLLGIKDGDGEAWNAFVRAYGPVICAYCLRRGLQDADARDVTQDVLAKVAREAGCFEYRPEKGRFRAWLYTLTKRSFIDHRRRVGRVVGVAEGVADRLDEALAPESPSSEWNDCFDSHVLSRALAIVESEFEPATWTIFLAVWKDDRLAVKVASEYGIKIATVYAYKSKVLKRVEEVMLGLTDDLPAYHPLT